MTKKSKFITAGVSGLVAAVATKVALSFAVATIPVAAVAGVGIAYVVLFQLDRAEAKKLASEAQKVVDDVKKV